jgi:hypothetical protein
VIKTANQSKITPPRRTNMINLSYVALGQILDAHGLPVPYPPATEPAPKVRAVFHDLMRERE